MRIGENVSLYLRAVPKGEAGVRVTFDIPDDVSVVRDRARVKLPYRGIMIGESKRATDG